MFKKLKEKIESGEDTEKSVSPLRHIPGLAVRSETNEEIDTSSQSLPDSLSCTEEPQLDEMKEESVTMREEEEEQSPLKKNDVRVTYNDTL